MNFAEEWLTELAGEVPSVLADHPNYTLPIILSRAQIGALMAPSLGLGSLALRTLYSSGMRPQELLDLRSTQLTGDGHVALADRVVPLDGVTAGALGGLAALRGPAERLFGADEGLLLGWLEGAALAAGVGQRYGACQRLLTPAALRHAYASHALENGMDIIALHHLLGHENLGCTTQYVHTAVGLRGAGYGQSHPLMQGQQRLTHWHRAGLEPPESGEGEDGEEEELKGVATPTVEEMVELLESPQNERDRLMLRLYYVTGMRRNELLEVYFADVVEEERRIFVRDAKEGKDRYVLVDPHSLSLLRQWRAEWPAGERIIALKQARVGEIFCECADRIGLRQRYQARGQVLSLHSLRHAFATHCYANGLDMISLKRLLGHAQLTTTILYLECPWERCQRSYLQCVGSWLQ